MTNCFVLVGAIALVSWTAVSVDGQQRGGDVRCNETTAVRRDAPPQEGADPLGSGPWYINADATVWALKQRWQPGVFLKTVWVKPVRTMLIVVGRRLDAAAPALESAFPRDTQAASNRPK